MSMTKNEQLQGIALRKEVVNALAPQSDNPGFAPRFVGPIF